MTSQATKYSQTIVAVDVALRKRAVNGSRIHIKATELTNELSVGVSQVSAALSALAQIPDSGLKRLKAGEFEYRTPDVYPQGLEVLKAQLRTAPRKQPRRGSLMSEVIEYLRDFPGELVTVASVTEALHAHSGSISAVLLRLSDSGYLHAEIARGVYRVLVGRSSVAPAPTGPTMIIDDLSGVQKVIMDRVIDDNLPNGDAALVSGEQARRSQTPLLQL